jgi:predicted phosphodiesterase
MQVDIFSDIHANAMHDKGILWTYITTVADVAIVAGDIDSREFGRTIIEIASKYKKVIAVLGNHDCYHKDVKWKPETLPENVSLLNPGTVEHQGIIFIGARLWTDFDNGNPTFMSQAKRMINDFRLIGNKGEYLKPEDIQKIHIKEKAYIRKQLKKHSGKKIVVITHFMPSYELVRQKWKNEIGNEGLNHYFSASCDDLIVEAKEAGAVAHIFGHTHDFIDEELHGLRMVCNPLGYFRENPNFKNLTIEI